MLAEEARGKEARATGERLVTSVGMTAAKAAAKMSRVAAVEAAGAVVVASAAREAAARQVVARGAVVRQSEAARHRSR